MALSYYSGKPGHGKSYNVTRRVIIPAINQGRKIITNIPLTRDAFDLAKDKGAEIVIFSRGNTSMADIADMLLMDKDESTGEYVPNPANAGAVFIIDEFMFYCANGVKVSSIDDKIKAFFAMHRHIKGRGFSTEIIIISQELNQLCGLVKGLIDQSFVFQKTMVGKQAVINTNIYGGLPSGKNSSFLRKETEKINPDYFKYYNSQTMPSNEDGGIGIETKTDDATNLAKHPAFKYLIAAALLLPVSFYFAYDRFTKIFGNNETKSEQNQNTEKTKYNEINQKKNEPNTKPQQQSKNQNIEHSGREKTSLIDEYNIYYVGKMDLDGLIPNYKTIYLYEAQKGFVTIQLTNKDLISIGYNVKILNDYGTTLISDNYGKIRLVGQKPEQKKIDIGEDSGAINPS